MIFSLDIRRAREGDCLILHYGSMTDPGLVLIDGGPANVYKPHLRPRLIEIKQQRNLAEDKPLPIDLLMVSHIDDDHINGVLELTRELVTAKDSQKPLPFKIRNFWHNTFDDIIGNSSDELRAAVTASFGAASLSGEPDSEGLEPTAAKVLASVGQGLRLRDDARALNLPINSSFNEKLIKAPHTSKNVDMGKGLKFIVAGPLEPELLALQKEHATFMKKKLEEKKKKEALASFTDTSIPNLSSLVLLAQAGKKPKKRILLTGDARGDKILAGLELVGLLKKGGTIHVDILKMPHHGSDRNLDPVFFERITADHYVFSGNGDYGNPERATLQWLWDTRGDAPYTVHLTYPVEEIDINRKKDWESEQGKEKSRKLKNPDTVVRENWSHEKHSLECFVAEHEKFAEKLSVIKQGEPHVINLLEEVGF
jgi:beta-lactamase superfamily II metal-dependent hydrolase